MIGSLMVNYVCRNNVPSFVLLKVFAKFNTLRRKYHRMLNTVTRFSIQYTRKLKWICDHEYGSTVTHLINWNKFCFNRELNRDEFNNNNTIYTSYWRSYRWFLFIFKVRFGRQTIWCYRSKVSLRQAPFITFTNHKAGPFSTLSNWSSHWVILRDW